MRCMARIPIYSGYTTINDYVDFRHLKSANWLAFDGHVGVATEAEMADDASDFTQRHVVKY